jgi:hypothetical protein
MNTAHTTGPWRIVGGTEIRDANGSIVCDTATYPCAIPNRPEDNARLIAAAPDLLDALQTLLARIKHDSTAMQRFTFDEVKVARDAITKATGGAA